MRSIAIRHIFDKPQRHKENAGFAGNTFPCESTTTSPVTRKEPLSFTLICKPAIPLLPKRLISSYNQREVLDNMKRALSLEESVI